MFLDGQLRAIEAAKQGLTLRSALFRRLAGLEVASAKLVVQNALAGMALGLTLAERLVAWLRKH